MHIFVREWVVKRTFYSIYNIHWCLTLGGVCRLCCIYQLHIFGWILIAFSSGDSGRLEARTVGTSMSELH